MPVIPRRCTCGVHRYDRCPDNTRPEHHRDDRMAPMWAAVLSVVVCIIAGGLAAGGWFAVQVFL